MIWDTILQGDPGPNIPLRQRIDLLLDNQRQTWPTFRHGEAALAKLQRKTLVLPSSKGSGSESVTVQSNPARRRSTLAKTDAATVAARACFLCPQNMPPEERGVAFEDFVVLPNPYPVLPLHFTVACREHRPQTLVKQIGAFLRLAKEIGPEMAALYNGPRCGASAPDHLHFQTARANEIPLLSQLPSVPAGRSFVPHSIFGRNMLVFVSGNELQIQANIERSVDALRQIEAPAEEPMFNLLAHFESRGYSGVLFPRAAHRPACYFKTGPDHLAISPAILEMCGILVATEPDHFARIDSRIARSIYEQVSISPDRFEQLITQ
jgi:hypothetical protein